MSDVTVELEDLVRVWELAAAWRSVHPDNTTPGSAKAIDAIEQSIDATPDPHATPKPLLSSDCPGGFHLSNNGAGCTSPDDLVQQLRAHVGEAIERNREAGGGGR